MFTDSQISALHGFYLTEIAAHRGRDPEQVAASRAAAAVVLDAAGVPWWLQNLTAAAAERGQRFPLARPNRIRAALDGHPAPDLSGPEQQIARLLAAQLQRQAKNRGAIA